MGRISYHIITVVLMMVVEVQAASVVGANPAITPSTKTKITYDAKGLVTAGADATTADIADSTNKRYVTDAQLTVIGNTSGTNTGDQTTITGNAGTATALQTARTINGVSFDGTANIQTATSDTSDYSTSSWTPTFTSDSGSITCSTLTGLYTKIGNQVTVTAKAVVSSVSTPGGNVNFGNFPYPTATGVGGSASASVSGYGFEATMTTSLIMPLDNNASTFNIFKMNGAGSVATLAADIKAGTTLFISATYITN